MTMLAQIERRLKEYAALVKSGKVVPIEAGKKNLNNNDVIMIGVPVPKEIHARMVIAAKERNTTLKRLVVEVLERVYAD